MPAATSILAGVRAAKGSAGLGVIGITTSGVAIFNPYEADGRTVALDDGCALLVPLPPRSRVGA